MHIVHYKKDTYAGYIIVKLDWINNIEHMRIWGIEPSLLIYTQTCIA